MTHRAGHFSWRICADTGGTFTDCVAVDPTGQIQRAKVLSSGALRARLVRSEGRRAWLDGPEGIALDLLIGFRLRGLRISGDHLIVGIEGDALLLDTPPDELDIPASIEMCTGESAPILAARIVTATPPGQPLPPTAFRLATTRGTNALLQRRVESTAMFVTSGFADLLEIGDQRRPDLFAVNIIKPAPWHVAVAEVSERIGARGEEIEPLNLDTLRGRAQEILSAGVRTAAVALVHSWINPDHEQRVGRLLRELGFRHVTLSSDGSPRIRLLPRARTALVNACLSGVIEPYLDSISAALGRDSSLEVMTSSGGLVDAASFAPRDSLLSGPAAGVAGAAQAGRRSGFDRIIAFDMGGTSTDVSRIEGEAFEYTFSHHVAGAEVLAPALAIESVAAGGGSICHVSHGALAVGPHSAGADPGPACYGAGGPLTVTDVNVLLGRLDPARFGIPVDPAASRRAFEQLCTQLGGEVDHDGVLEGLIDIANETMAQAITAISVRKGYDPADYALVSFGGAGPQHACAIAERLGMRTIVIPPDASLLSAVGLRQASEERIAERQVLRELADVRDDLPRLLDELGAQAMLSLGALGDRCEIRRQIVSLRFVGQEHTIEIEWADDCDRLVRDFEDRCRMTFGYMPHGRAVEVEAVRVVVGRHQSQSTHRQETPDRFEPQAVGNAQVHLNGDWASIPTYNRDALGSGAMVAGPAIVFEQRSSTLVAPGWSARVDCSGALVMTRDAADSSHRSQAPRAVRDELIAGGLTACATEMGEMLRRTAISANVKERLDFSCAVLDREGMLIASAPHIPVHLGALGLCVRRLRNVLEMAPGDIVVTNHPAYGGSHLPDVTAVAPVFAGGELVGHVACRAHHAEIGGSAPGSMPPHARTLAEEGVVIAPMKLFDAGEPRWDRLSDILAGGHHPTRAPADNVADIAGAVAALRRGIAGIEALCARYRPEGVREAMAALTKRTEAAARAALRRAGPTINASGSAREVLEDSFNAESVIQVRASVDDERILIDFTGTTAEHVGNLNAPLAVTRSAVMYVIRLMLGAQGRGIPLNEGLLGPVDLVVPPGLLNPAFCDDAASCPAVAGGNVETSQRVVSALVRAFGLCAAGQGTMNNVLFGDDRFGYYETVCGGDGAGPGFDGAGAVHTHMTNTAITDTEVMEWRYPVRVCRFEVRHGTGGAGAWTGGDGVVREIEFLRPVRLSMVTQGRTRGGAGMAGGSDGAPGRQRVVRTGGDVVELGSIDGCEIGEGDRLILETPGGGGWGAVESSDPTT